MIQRLIYQLLVNGLAAFATNSALYSVVFADYLHLGDAEVAAIRAYFAKNLVRVQHGYPARDIRPPLIAILLQSESVGLEFLGTSGMVPMGLGGGMGTGSLWDQSYQLMCYTENIDATSYLYEVLKAILVCSHRTLAEAGVMHPTYTGMDLAPDTRYLPENLFVRILGVRLQSAYVLPELFEQANLAKVFGGLNVAAGTARAPESYTSGIQLFAQTP